MLYIKSREDADWCKQALCSDLVLLSDEEAEHLTKDEAFEKNAEIVKAAFYPGKGDSTEEAEKCCAACPVRIECLEYSLYNNERFGIWGGTSGRTRRRIHRMRKQKKDRSNGASSSTASTKAK